MPSPFPDDSDGILAGSYHSKRQHDVLSGQGCVFDACLWRVWSLALQVSQNWQRTSCFWHYTIGTLLRLLQREPRMEQAAQLSSNETLYLWAAFSASASAPRERQVKYWMSYIFTCGHCSVHRLLNVKFCTTNYEAIFVAYNYQRFDRQDRDKAEVDFFWLDWSNATSSQLIRSGGPFRHVIRTSDKGYLTEFKKTYCQLLICSVQLKERFLAFPQG